MPERGPENHVPAEFVDQGETVNPGPEALADTVYIAPELTGGGSPDEVYVVRTRTE